LENLFRLNALLRAIYIQRADEEANLNFVFFLREYKYQDEYLMPQFLPGLVNKKIENISIRKEMYIYKHTLIDMVAGGVSMEFPINLRRFKASKTKKLNKLYNKVLGSRPNQKTLCWKVAF